MEGKGGFDTDVLIVGAGPTGITTALALATYGVRCHMVARWNWLADTPRAHITNQRTMEVMRDLGLEDELRRSATPWEDMGDSMFTTSLAGEELVRLRAWGTGEARQGDYRAGSPCTLLDIPQPVIEPILFKNALARGAIFSGNTEYLSHEQDEDGVTVVLQDRLSGREYRMRARYLVGADGARSKVFEDLGLSLEGQLARAGTAYIQFEADLSQYVAHRPSILHWIVSPKAAFGEIGFGLLRAVQPWTQWIAGWGFDMKKGEPDLSNDDYVRDQIRALVGDDQLQPRILKRSIWYVNQAYAPLYARGRVFCGGDACHRHPPSSGLGLNTCVQDAFNLAWKLAYVIQGDAGPALLQSYSAERAPVGRQIVERANQSRLDYGPLKAVFRVEGAENPVAAGIARFKDPGPEGVQARGAVQEALVLKNREFNAQGVEMNQRYDSCAVLPAPDAEVWRRDRELYLQATTRPGAKVPHVWLVDASGRKSSLLDLTGKGRFTLVTGLAGKDWVTAAQALALRYLDTLVIGSQQAQDVYCEWQASREMEEGGALLVRPDGVVAWRQSRMPRNADAAEQILASVLGSVLGRAGSSRPEAMPALQVS